jgi:hypothetical protein
MIELRTTIPAPAMKPIVEVPAAPAAIPDFPQRRVNGVPQG